MRRLVFALLFLFPVLAAAQGSYLDYPGAINKAGRQRMLSEYIVKEYLQVAEGIDAGSARGHLTEAVWVVDDQIGDLKAFAKTPEARQAVADLEREWTVMRQFAAAAPSRERVTAMREAGLKFYEAADRNAWTLVREFQTPIGHLINLSGRQRMLSQRIAKSYLFIAAHVDERAAREELAAARVEFDAGLRELRAAPENVAEIGVELDAVQALWSGLQRLLARERVDRQTRLEVVNGADAILSRMERITSLYVGLAAN